MTQNSYLASEGFIGFEVRPEAKGMRMLLTNGIFFEFIPFDEDHFDAEGEVLPGARACHIGEVEEGKPYALLLSTCAGAWRYLIGDVIQFTDKERSEIIVSGRTKHYISLTGEHLSVDNMNRAIEKVSEEMNLDIREFTVAGIPYDGLFAHQWWIGSDDTVNEEAFRQCLDKYLCELNDDYATERTSALKEVFVTIVPTSFFLDWMKQNGKLGGQHKFPRVLKGQQQEEWELFLKLKKPSTD